MRRAERGLTLLEVLGAVALLGILYTVLAGSAIDGLRSEGESRRRLRASLIADEKLTAIEMALLSGAAPPIGETSEPEDDFTIVTRVSGFDPASARPAVAETRSGPRSLAARRAEASREEAPSIFDEPETPTTPPALRSIDVIVRWEEGVDEREVRRTTYALDAQAVDALFATVGDARSRRLEQEGTGEEAGQPGNAPTDAETLGLDPDQPLPNFDLPGLFRERGELQ